MAGTYTDSDDDEKAVEEILSQAVDASILEQVASINNAAFRESYLPSHLETRFQTLKSYQSSITKPVSLTSPSLNPSHSSRFKRSTVCEENNKEQTEKGEKKFEQCGEGFYKYSKKSPQILASLTPSKLSEIKNSSPSKINPAGIFGKKGKKSHSFNFWEGFSRIGCFLCNPNNKVPVASRKSTHERRGFDSGHDDHDEFLSDFSHFSFKNQKKIMKKAIKEEKKILREAEKIVKWVQHASAAMEMISAEK